MRIVRQALLILGTLAALLGAFWMLQGLGVIRWPASSFMLGDYAWVVVGSIVAIGGLIAILIARRLPRR